MWLKEIEVDIKWIFKFNVLGFFNDEEMTRLEEHEGRKNTFVLDHGVDCMVKNREIFHKYAIYRKNYNTICEMRNGESIVDWNYKDSLELGIQKFSSIYKEPKLENTNKTIQMDS